MKHHQRTQSSTYLLAVNIVTIIEYLPWYLHCGQDYIPNTPTGFKLYRATVEDIIIDIYFYHLNHSFNLSASTPFK